MKRILLLVVLLIFVMGFVGCNADPKTDQELLTECKNNGSEKSCSEFLTRTNLTDDQLSELAEMTIRDLAFKREECRKMLSSLQLRKKDAIRAYRDSSSSYSNSNN